MTAEIAEQPPAAVRPRYKISELTTYELRDFRREPEQDDRARIARA